MKNFSFEWEGHTSKPKAIDRIVIYLIWIVVILLIIGLGILVNRQMETRGAENHLIVTRKMETEQPISLLEKITAEASLITEESQIREVPPLDSATYTVRLNTKYQSFRNANQEALTYLDRNFKVQIVPEGEGYFIELEEFDRHEEGSRIVDSLRAARVDASLVERSKEGLIPQKNLEEELLQLKKLSPKPGVKQTTEVLVEQTKVEGSQALSPSTEEIKEEIKPSFVAKQESTPIVVDSREMSFIKDKEMSTMERPKTIRGADYSLQAGAYRLIEGAEKLAQFLTEKSGFSAYVLRRDGLYKVYCGQFSTYEKARAGYDQLPVLSFEGGEISFFIVRVSD
ncbi:MAG: SPOR domain-containing protein [Candidatus Wallbacteria bacterium]|nr:SPOR domain-containing protein [Candidatus Wallbacteria bacterium]